jgi:ribosome-binding protein aMBF1 (putative translation factor)
MKKPNPKKAGRKPKNTPLFQRRQAANLSRQEVADKLGVRLTDYQRIESGAITAPYPEKIQKLADILTRGNCNPIIADLIAMAQEKKNPKPPSP